MLEEKQQHCGVREEEEEKKKGVIQYISIMVIKN
jgi:hypothetical protein